MCTLVVAAGVVPEVSVLVVANRDEQLDRPASPPRWWDEGFFAPRDERAGGTWLGLSAAGVFVAITNRSQALRDASRVSRGAVVAEALRLPTAAAIHDAMREVDPARHNGFHLVYADGRDVLATVSDGVTLAQLTLGQGLTIVTERSFGAGDDRARVTKMSAAWERLRAPGSAGGLERFTALLTEHDRADPLASTCIHLPGLGYGTRSAMVLGFTPIRHGVRAPPTLLWAEGPPCTTAFSRIDVSRFPLQGAEDDPDVSAPAKTS